MENTFRDGAIKTTSSDVNKSMPPVSRFGCGDQAKKKQNVIEKFKTFLKSTLGLVLPIFLNCV